MSAVLNKLQEIVKDLPAESQAEVVDFAEFLREKKLKQTSQPAPPKERVAGLHEG